MINVGIFGRGFVGGALKNPGPMVSSDMVVSVSPMDVNAFAKMTEGTPLGTLLEYLHELNVHFRGVEEHI